MTANLIFFLICWGGGGRPLGDRLSGYVSVHTTTPYQLKPSLILFYFYFILQICFSDFHAGFQFLNKQGDHWAWKVVESHGI